MIELEKTYNPHAIEEKIYSEWESGGYFHARADSRKKPYTIVIPPPNITGILHMGHALNNTIQDILIRFNRMRGYSAEWMPGTDHAGIATQNVVEKKLLKSGIKRHDIGREKFVDEVWRWRDEYGSTIVRQLKKLGCSCDWERIRFTMDEGLSKAVLEVFIRLYEKGLIYRGNYIINWCPRCQTALSDEESQHKDTDGMLYYIKYPIKGAAKYNDEHVVIATTRPETLLGDVAIAINPEDERYTALKGKTVILPIIERELKIIYDDMVDMKFGTGALKVTPAHDPVDFELGKRHGLESINIMNDDATINAKGSEYEGMDRLEAREAIVTELKERGLFIKSESHRHAVGHCYRCHTMVEPRLSPQWFVRMKPLAAPAIDAVKDGRVKFFPGRWTKVYLDWMENIRDWCISRQIWWGHRIPVYYCKACNKKDPVKGIIVSKIAPTRCRDCGSEDIVQDPDVLDTWFSSWLWPFSTFGWPEKTPELDYFYPTDALVTAQEIIFFWVARMIMAGLEFKNDIPFKNVYIHGTVRDITGTKMSKSLGNVIDPIDMIRKYGTDALRFSIISITSQGQDVYLSESKFELGRNFANKIWNASRFILMNVKADNIPEVSEALYDVKDMSLPERWIISRFYSTLSKVSGYLDHFKFNDAANAIYEFLWHEFCDWYIEIAKLTIDEKRSQIILISLLEMSLRILHPFMPFITEEIWQKLPAAIKASAKSIMVSDWPIIKSDVISASDERNMSFLISVVSAVRNMRAVWNIEPKRALSVIVNTHDKEKILLIADNADFVKRLGKISDLKAGDFKKPKNSALTVIENMEIYLPLEGLIDFAKEKARLEKDESRMMTEMKGLESRLSDQNFMSRAPEEVVVKQKTRREELKIEIEKLRQNLNDIKV